MGMRLGTLVIQPLWSIRVRKTAVRTLLSALAWEGNEMRIIVLFLLVSLYTTTAMAGGPAERKITIEQARALVMASLTAKQSRMPKVEAEHFDDPDNPSPRF